MKPVNASETTTGDFTVIDEENLENALLDYDDTANRTLSGTSYRCRDCGQLYETIEEHDRHRRKVHNQIEKYPLEELPM